MDINYKLILDIEFTRVKFSEYALNSNQSDNVLIIQHRSAQAEAL